MSFAPLVHASARQVSGTGTATTAARDTTGADFIVIGIGCVNSGVFTVSDSKGNVWTPMTMKNGNAGGAVQLFYCKAPTVGSGHTFSVASGGFASATILMQAFSGALLTGGVDQSNSNMTNATTIQPGSITPVEDNELIITLAGGVWTGVLTINSGYTIGEQLGLASGDFAVALGYLVQGAKAATNPTWSGLTTDGGNPAVIASFKVNAAVAPTAGFTIAIDLKTVTVTSTAVAGTNPITSTLYDWGDGTAPSAGPTHTYTTSGTFTITQTVSDGTLSASVPHNVITKTRYTYRVTTTSGGAYAEVTADRPDA